MKNAYYEAKQLVTRCRVKDIVKWMSTKFQQPLCPLFFLFGAVLVILGITSWLPSMGHASITDHYKWVAIALGIVFVLLAVIIDQGLLIRRMPIEEIPSKDMQSVGKEFAKDRGGEMFWFNVPLGRCIPPLFNEFLKPAIENENVSRIVFMLDITTKEIWDNFVAPAVRLTESTCQHGPKVVVRFHDLKSLKPVAHTMSFKLFKDSSKERVPEAHVCFYDESWMQRFSLLSGREELMPKRMIKVKPGCELFDEIIQLCDRYSVYEVAADTSIASAKM